MRVCESSYEYDKDRNVVDMSVSAYVGVSLVQCKNKCESQCM